MSIRPSGARARLRARERGFTLTELMVVVALVGTLAAIGVASFTREVSASKSTEAAAVVQALRGAEETYRAENQRYFDVSTASGRWYPAEQFNDKAYSWEQPSHPDYARWKRLGAHVNQPVMFRYRVRAGAPGTNFPVLLNGLNLGVAVEPWYVVEARADADKNGVFCDAIATSLNNELVINNQGE